ncbi:TlpA family protein disulfide reductase [Flavitalea flava]
MSYSIKVQAWVMSCLLSTIVSLAQNSYLQPGDQMPDLALNSLLNYPSGQARISDFRGKLLIIDFWDRGCTSCIAAFPRLEALQEQFKGRIQFITVTKNSPGQIDTLFMQPWITRQHARRSQLPSLMADTGISGLFRPFFYVPHHIWIDETGKILYITNGYNATAGHIQSVLDGKRPFMLPKVDVRRDVIDEQPLTAYVGQHMADHVKYSSFFMDYSNELANLYSMSRHIDSAKQLFRMSYTNFSMLHLFQEAFTKGEADQFNNDFFNENRIEWKIPDHGVFFRPTSYDSLDEWTVHNFYNYEQVAPLKDKPKCYQLMQEDVNRYFGGLRGILARIVTEKKKCLVLVNERTTPLKTKGDKPMETFYSKEDEIPEWRAYINTPLKEVVMGIYASYTGILRDGPIPFIDETTYAGNVDLKIDFSAKTVAELNRQLHLYGLRIIQADRWIKMLQIEKMANYAKQ